MEAIIILGIIGTGYILNDSNNKGISTLPDDFTKP